MADNIVVRAIVEGQDDLSPVLARIAQDAEKAFTAIREAGQRAFTGSAEAVGSVRSEIRSLEAIGLETFGRLKNASSEAAKPLKADLAGAKTEAVALAEAVRTVTAEERRAVDEAAMLAEKLGLTVTSVDHLKTGLEGVRTEARGAAESLDVAAGTTSRMVEHGGQLVGHFREMRGLIGLIAGAKIAEMSGEGLHKAADLTAVKSSLHAVGMSDDEIGEVSKDWRQFTSKPALRGVSESEYLAAYKDARSIDPHNPGELTHDMLLARLATRNSGSEFSEHDLLQVAKTLDELPLDREGKRKLFDTEVKLKQNFGDLAKPEDFLHASRNMRAARLGISEEFANETLPILTQMFGQNVGVMAATGYQNLIGGHMTKIEAKAMQSLGFIKPGEIAEDAGGRAILPKNMLREDLASLYQRDPYQAALEMHREFMARPGATEEGWRTSMATLPRNAGDFFMSVTDPKIHSQIERDRENFRKSLGMRAADDQWIISHNADAAWVNFKSTVTQAVTDAATPVVENAIPALNGAAGLAHGVSTGMQADRAENKAAHDAAVGTGYLGVTTAAELASLGMTAPLAPAAGVAAGAGSIYLATTENLRRAQAVPDRELWDHLNPGITASDPLESAIQTVRHERLEELRAIRDSSAHWDRIEKGARDDRGLDPSARDGQWSWAGFYRTFGFDSAADRLEGRVPPSGPPVMGRPGSALNPLPEPGALTNALTGAQTVKAEVSGEARVEVGGRIVVEVGKDAVMQLIDQRVSVGLSSAARVGPTDGTSQGLRPVGAGRQ